jgi:hypothetical protein
MVEDLQEPVDKTHERTTAAVRIVNGMFQEAKDRAARWEPRPCPAT